MKKLKLGDLAPTIECKNQDGKIIKLSNFLGKKVVIFFYPRANTPGCTAQACNLGENYNEFKKRGYEILGVSADNQKSQNNFSKKYKNLWLSSNLMYSRSLNYQWDLEDYTTPYYHPGNDVNNFHMTLKLAYLFPLTN